MTVRNPGKVGKDVRLQKKPPKKVKPLHFSGGEERPTLAGKKRPPRRNKQGVHRNSRGSRQAGGHADDKIQSLEALFGECPL